MNKQILKLLWNRKKTFIWIFLEQVLVFIVLLFCFLEFSNKYKEYKHPGNLSLKNVCMFGLVPNQEKKGFNLEEFKKKENDLMNSPEIKEYIQAAHKGLYTVPENRPAWNNEKDSILYKGKKYSFFVKASDEFFPVVFQPKMIEGTWFTKDEPFDDGVYPAVITKSLVQQMEITDPIGTRFSYEGKEFKVTGVTYDFKTMTYDPAQPSLIFALSAFIDKSWSFEKAILIKEGRKNDLINHYWREVNRIFPGEGHQPVIYMMEDLKSISTLDVRAGTFIVTIPILFLIIFAFLGTFSLMYRQSKKQQGEYGLRMAMGSTRSQLSKFIFLQGCAITCLSTLMGLFLGVNLYILVFNEVDILTFIISTLISTGLMFLFAIISVWYPGYAASKIQPAIALKSNE